MLTFYPHCYQYLCQTRRICPTHSCRIYLLQSLKDISRRKKFTPFSFFCRPITGTQYVFHRSLTIERHVTLLQFRLFLFCKPIMFTRQNLRFQLSIKLCIVNPLTIDRILLYEVASDNFSDKLCTGLMKPSASDSSITAFSSEHIYQTHPD